MSARCKPLKDPPLSLAELATKFLVSPERVRQIEARAPLKLCEAQHVTEWLPSFFNPKKFKEEKLVYRYISGDIIHCWRIGGLREKRSYLALERSGSYADCRRCLYYDQTRVVLFSCDTRTGNARPTDVLTHESGYGTFETCQPALTMSGVGGEADLMVVRPDFSV